MPHLQEGSGNSNTLPLTAREKQASVSHQRLITFWEVADEVMSIGSTSSLLNLLLRAVSIQPISYVVGYAACKHTKFTDTIAMLTVIQSNQRV